MRAAGLEVDIFDNQSAAGGRAGVYRQQGFTFDAGTTVITAPFLIDELCFPLRQAPFRLCFGAALYGAAVLRDIVSTAPTRWVGTLLIKANQPASLSTMLLVVLGSMQAWQAHFEPCLWSRHHHGNRRTRSPIPSPECRC